MFAICTPWETSENFGLRYPTFLYMYVCDLWNLNEKDFNIFRVAWTIIQQRIIT